MSTIQFNQVTGCYGADDSEQSFGGAFIPPHLQPVLDKITQAFLQYKDDEEFNKELHQYLREFVGRPSPLTLARNLSTLLNTKARIYLKREDLNHTGSHKINNVMGQILLARKMGYKRIICDTGAGQHGVAAATAVALFQDMSCVVYMGAEDCRKQSLNVFRMKILGAQVISVSKGQGVLRDAVDEAFGDLMQNFETSYYVMGSAVGPHPYPWIVKHFQSVISKESLQQVQEFEGRQPTMVVACVGGGSNAIGAFAQYLTKECENVRLIGVEPDDAASLTQGSPFVMHGFKTLVYLDENNEPKLTDSISSGLNHPAVGPEHAYLKNIGRCEYQSVNRELVLEAFLTLAKTEGVIPALESTHAVAHVIRMGREGLLKDDDIVVINISGRGDKDVEQVYEMVKDKME